MSATNHAHNSQHNGTATEPEADSKLMDIRAMQPRAIEAAKWRTYCQREGIPLGPSTGFKAIDEMLDGYMAPGMHILHGSPGVGKSALALAMAVECGCPAIYVSAELHAEVILCRLMARALQTPMGIVRRYSEWETYQASEKVINKYPLFTMLDASYAGADIGRLKRAIDTVKHSHPQRSKSGVLIVVDSVHTWAQRQYSDRQEYDRLNYALSHLEVLAQASRCPILAIAERNRASKDDTGVSSAKGSSRFEYAGESVMALDEVRTGDLPPGQPPQYCTPVTLTVSKNRFGTKGRIHLTWHGATQTHKLADDLDPEGKF